MTVHFKNPFSTGGMFHSPFKAAPKPAESAPQPGMARHRGATDLPRRAGSSTASESEVRTDRRGSVHDFRSRRPAPPTGGHSGTGVPPGTGHPQSKGDKLLGAFKLAEIDRMTAAQLGQVLEYIGLPAGSSLANAPTKENWQTLRNHFEDRELEVLLRRRPDEVVQFLIEARPGTSGTAAAEPRPAFKPVSLLGMNKENAIQALRDRGMNEQTLRQFKEDFFSHVQHGNSETGAALNKRYGAYVSDDFTSSATYATYAKLLGTLR